MNKKQRGEKGGPKIRVAIVDDHTLVREGLTAALKSEEGISVVFDTQNGIEFFEKLKSKTIDIALVDLDMPEMNGKEVLAKLTMQHPDIGVIIFSMHTNVHIVAELIQMGAKSYLKKDCKVEELVDAIYNVQFNGYHSTEIVSEAMFIQAKKNNQREEAMAHFNFSTREMMIIRLICSGSTSEAIAERIGLSKKSIDGTRSKLFKLLHAKTTADFARICIERGLFQPIGRR